MGVTDENSYCRSGLLLLADAAEMVSSNPSLLHSPLEAELRRLRHAWSAPGVKAKRSPRAKKIFKKVEKVDALTGKKGGWQEGGICKKKKKKIGGTLLHGGSAAAMKRHLPVEVRSRIKDRMSGTDVKLILQKELTESDLNPNLGRFSIPSSLVLTDFLDQGERQWLENGGVITVPVIEPGLEVSHPTLKRWKMSTKPVYVLTTGWNDLARTNSLEVGKLIHVWSFRTEGRIGFAIVKCGDAAAAAGDHQAVGKRSPSPASVLEFPPH